MQSIEWFSAIIVSTVHTGWSSYGYRAKVSLKQTETLKSSYRVEKHPANVIFCLKWYYKVYETLTVRKLEKKVAQLESHEKLHFLLQGIGVCC